MRPVALCDHHFSSWGGIAQGNCLSAAPQFLGDLPGALATLEQARGSVLAFGCGRSYGDSCLNRAGGMLRMTGMDRVHHFDVVKGVLRADAGLTLDQLHTITVPKGWLVAVTPGTRFVTLGGAVANDVHGKNHHGAGSFGCHVRALGLRRSDGTTLTCSADGNAALFATSIGGLGLTGVIEWVEVQLMPIASSDMEVENQRFAHLEDFFDLSAQSADWPYTVAWLDCLSRKGRGIFCRARHADDGPLQSAAPSGPAIPFTPPVSLVNGATLRAFNSFYYLRPIAARARQHFQTFFYPLDGVRHWNRIYGSRGFYQYQCVIPPEVALLGVQRILAIIRSAGDGSFLVVIKNFGSRASPGLLSFPREGTTLAVDFANRGDSTLKLLAALDKVVASLGGRLYPAKDGRISAAMFQAGYPAWRQFLDFRDPGLRSDFWARVTSEAQK